MLDFRPGERGKVGGGECDHCNDCGRNCDGDKGPCNQSCGNCVGEAIGRHLAAEGTWSKSGREEALRKDDHLIQSSVGNARNDQCYVNADNRKVGERHYTPGCCACKVRSDPQWILAQLVNQRSERKERQNRRASIERESDSDLLFAQELGQSYPDQSCLIKTVA